MIGMTEKTSVATVLQANDTTMTLRNAVGRVLQHEGLNFTLTNRIPRRALTLFAGWFSRIRQPWIRVGSIALWRFFADVDLSEAKKQHFESLHDCFTRELKEGARPIVADPQLLASPCDAIIGATGQVSDGIVLQAKDQAYPLTALLGDGALTALYQHGTYVTLRLTAGMYHRFHAPYDCRIKQVNYFSGDTWNVNPIALRRVAQLFCKNERAVIRCQLAGSQDLITLVPVAAILVASIRLHFLDTVLHLRYRGRSEFKCDVPIRKGEEIGWFQHGSTVLVFAPPGYGLVEGVAEGLPIRVGEPLLRLPAVRAPDAHPCETSM
jgi:phosphatidylserine decarboxylase